MTTRTYTLTLFGISIESLHVYLYDVCAVRHFSDKTKIVHFFVARTSQPLQFNGLGAHEKHSFILNFDIHIT